MTPRERLLAALKEMPDEAFAWLALALPSSAMLKGGRTQVWPDGIGGFCETSQASITEARAAAAEYLAELPE
jgi:hypothetical protein